MPDKAVMDQLDGREWRRFNAWPPDSHSVILLHFCSIKVLGLPSSPTLSACAGSIHRLPLTVEAALGSVSSIASASFGLWTSAKVLLAQRAACCKCRSVGLRSSGPGWVSAGAAQAFKRHLQSRHNPCHSLSGHMLRHLPPPCCSR